MLHNNEIKILIAFDEQLVADGIQCVLSHENNFKVVGLVNNQEKIFQAISNLNPDIIVFEFSYWTSNCGKLITDIHSAFQHVKILVVSEMVTHDILKDLMHIISGYMVRTCSAEKLVLGINEISNSGKYMCPTVLDKFFACTRTVKNDNKLTVREREVLCKWIESNGNEEIADFLNISVSTVRTHMNNIRQKLGIINHLQLMIYACRQNILDQNFKPVCPNCRSFCN